MLGDTFRESVHAAVGASHGEWNVAGGGSRRSECGKGRWFLLRASLVCGFWRTQGEGPVCSLGDGRESDWRLTWFMSTAGVTSLEAAAWRDVWDSEPVCGRWRARRARQPLGKSS